MSPTRVLWLTAGLGRGGAERLLVGLARTIDRERFAVEVAYVKPWKDALVGDLEDAGVVVHCLGHGRALGPLWAPRLARLTRARGYEIVHTHAPGVGVVARLTLGRRTNIVHTEHNDWARHRRSARLFNALTFARNDAVIAVSNGVARSIRPIGRRRAPEPQVIVHGPDAAAVRFGPDARARARATLGLADGALVVVTVGTLSPKKDQAVLLDAMPHVVAFADVQLVIIGTGVLDTDLERQAKALGLDERVVFLGARTDVQELLPAFDVFVLSSRYEGLPVSLLEAMATGVAPVATNVGGVPEVITDGENGLLVPPRDPAALANALATLLCDPAAHARLAAAAQRSSARFDLEAAARHTEGLYERVLGRSSS